MPGSATAPEPELDRQRQRFLAPSWWFLAIGAALEVPGILLLVLGHSWVEALGLAFIALGALPLTVGAALLVSAAVTGWTAHRRPLA